MIQYFASFSWLLRISVECIRLSKISKIDDNGKSLQHCDAIEMYFGTKIPEGPMRTNGYFMSRSDAIINPQGQYTTWYAQIVVREVKVAANGHFIFIIDLFINL